jgi:hypothetical protein
MMPRLLRIRFGAFYVRERDLQAAPECEEAVHAFYMDDQGVLGKLHLGHGGVTPFPCAYHYFSAHYPLQRSPAHLAGPIHWSAWKKNFANFVLTEF